MSEKTNKFTKEDIEKNKGMAVVAYFLFFVPLLTDAKDSPYAKFHIKQGLMLLLYFIASWFVSFFLMFILIGFLIAPILYLFGLVMLIIGIINSVNGQAKQLPLIGQFADQWFKF